MQTRIVDSEQYDDCCDVIKWLEEVVGVDVMLFTDDDSALFWVWYPGDARRPSGPLGCKTGTKFEFNGALLTLTQASGSVFEIPTPGPTVGA